MPLESEHNIPPLLTVRDVAEILRISQSKVYQLIDSGAVIAHRISGSIRVSSADLTQYLQCCRQQKSQTPRPSRERPRLKHIRLPRKGKS